VAYSQDEITERQRVVAVSSCDAAFLRIHSRPQSVTERDLLCWLTERVDRGSGTALVRRLGPRRQNR
jgi:hypothetical protein